MYGSLERLDDGRWVVRFTRMLSHLPEKVWRAITESEHLTHWFPTTIEGERAAGAPLRFSFPGGQAPPFEGEMLAYGPQSLLARKWVGGARFMLTMSRTSAPRRPRSDPRRGLSEPAVSRSLG